MLREFEGVRAIHEGSTTIIRRARRVSDDKPVVLKSPRAEYPSLEDRARIRHEFEILNRLRIPGVPNALALSDESQNPVLVLEDNGSHVLRGELTSEGMGLERFFTIALELTRIVGELHWAQVIHRNINPSNVVVSPRTGMPTLIDFAMASRVSREGSGLLAAAPLSGAIAYLSPEQTGRMSRTVDWRSDLYSLGATFYEMLTGQPPFTEQDRLSLVHALIARMPTPPHHLRPEVPEVLSGIVQKLLAKTAEDRYQSASALAHDLGEARRRLLDSGRIEPFELATRDMAYRLRIQGRIYGREEQLALLSQCFERVANGGAEVMVISGQSGIGKSALSLEIRKPVAERRGYLIEGKFDQFQRDVPYSPIVRALRDLMHQILTESESRLQHWKTRLQEALGVNAKLLTRSVPELEILLGPQPEMEESSAEENRRRVLSAFQRFVGCFCTQEHPLVIFLDDLQWADLASLELLQRMMGDAEMQSILLICAYRDDEVDATHPAVRMLEALAAQGQPVHQLSLKPLEPSHVRHLLADTLGRDEAGCQPLAELVYERTRGNPFFVREFVTSLYEIGLFRRAPGTDHWEWDLEEIRGQSVTDNVAVLMAQRLRRLPEATQHVLHLAACIGNRFDVQTLAVVYEHTPEQVVDTLSPAITAGMVVLLGASPRRMRGSAEESSPGPEPTVFCFAHDRVQQAAHELVAPEKRGAVHLKIGRLLLTNLSQAEREARLFEIVQQFAQALELVQEPAEREQLAELNLQAGIRARRAAAYVPAAAWLRIGRSLLKPDAWTSQYPLALGLYCEGAEVARLVTEFEEMDALAEAVMAHSRVVLDSLSVYETLIEYQTAQNRPSKALELAREVLHRLGVSLPARPTPVHVAASLLATMREMRGWQVSELSALPAMDNPLTLGAMRVLMRTISAAYIASPNTFPLIVFQMVRLSLRHGNSAQSPFGYVIYGIILSSVLSKHDYGYELGRFSLELMKRFQAFGLKAKLYVSCHVSLMLWKHHLRDSLDSLLEAFHSGLETGDVEYACHGAMMYSHYLVIVGDSLEVVQQRQAEFLAAIEKNKSEFHAIYTRVFQQFVLCLREQGEPLRLAGSAFQEEQEIPRLVAAKNLTALFSALHCKAQLCYLHGDPRGAIEHATSARAHEQAVMGSINAMDNIFIQTLALLACHSETNFRQRRTIAANRRKLRGWARQSAINFGHKHLLVEAEFARVTGRHAEASTLFEKAINGALEARYIQVAAMAMESAGRHHLALGMARTGWSSLHEAWRTYRGWGALHKARALEAELKSAGIPLAGSQAEPRRADQPLVQPVSLDLATILNASRAISQEIVLESLLRKLVRLLIENAGAERGVLILENDGQQRIEVESRAGEENVTQAGPLPMEGTSRLSVSILNYVVRTGENVVLHDATRQGLFTSDEYVLLRKPKSVLCAPLLNQGRLVAILYLENNLATGAFTAERLEVIRLLLAQAALSIHNARLYANLQVSNTRLEEYSRTLEEKVDARTRELRLKNDELDATLQQLRKTQKQLVQQEKLASLGTLTAGIAHELRNPLNFVCSFAELSLPLTTELSDTLVTQAGRMEPWARADAEESLSMLHGNLVKMREHGQRASGIINSMLQHSQISTTRELADLNTLLAQSVVLAHEAVRSKNRGLRLDIRTDYDPGVGMVEMAVSNISRVFINILDNALYALEEKLGQAGPDYVPSLHIRTKDLGQWCEIRIMDNGTGIPKEVADKIFNPFFTTKPAGQGTGLGLSLSHDIVVQGYQGELRVETVPGEFTEFIIRLPKKGTGTHGERGAA